MVKHTPLTKLTKNKKKQNPHRKKDNIQRKKINENIKKSKAPLIPAQKKKYHYNIEQKNYYNIEKKITKKFLAST